MTETLLPDILSAVSNIRQLTYHLAGPKPASVLQMTVTAACLRVQDFAAPVAQHLQTVIHVVRGCTRTGGSSGQRIPNMETCHEYYRQSAKSKQDVC